MQKTTAKEGLIYSIQRYCIHDGPGIRTTVFFKGCQLKCPWCANPESLHTKKEIAFMSHKCTMCGICLRKCPKGVIDLNRTSRIDRDKCDLCGECVRYCPVDCYNIYGYTITSEELLKEIEKDKLFYKNSGGGVTVSGGEATLYVDFLEEFLKLCKEHGIDTAIETHGFGEKEIFQKLAPYIDHFLVDVKHMDNKIHKEIIGVENITILNNIRILANKLNKEVSLRVPLIPGFNDSDNNIDKLIDFGKEIKHSNNLAMIHLLPYHSLGQSKYLSLDLKYDMEGTIPPSNEELKRLEVRIKEAGLPVIIGG